LHVVATKIYVKVFVRLQGDPASFKFSFPQIAYCLGMIDVLYKISDSTTISISKIYSEKVCYTNGHKIRARSRILFDTTDYLFIDAATWVDSAHGYRANPLVSSSSVSRRTRAAPKGLKMKTNCLPVPFAT